VPNEKVEDFYNNPSYERRLVLFYDVLGWKEQIRLAGSDPIKVGNLRRQIITGSRIVRAGIEYTPEMRFRHFPTTW
jgi:hypothetical protein